MKSKTTLWIFIGLALVSLIMAVPVFSVYYDGYFTNALVKGNLKVITSADIDGTTTIDGTLKDVTEPTVVNFAGTYYYDITAPGVYYCDSTQAADSGTLDGDRQTGSGVSMRFTATALSEENDGGVFRLYNYPGYSMIGTGGKSGASMFSGTTRVTVTLPVYPGSEADSITGITRHAWNVTSGVTYPDAEAGVGVIMAPEILEMDASGDWTEYKWVYDESTGGGTLFQTGRYIQ
jgi:hypothetical protein